MMKSTFEKNMLIAAAAIAAAFVLPSVAAAKVSGPCGNCHTMHNSQDGAPMASTGDYDPTGGLPLLADQQTAPNGALLRYGCIGCHTGDNVTGGAVPFVLGSTAPALDGSDSLAGGNFWWVDGGDNPKGHNVTTLPNVLSDMAAPGDLTPMPVDTLTCAGTNGCHGKQTVDDEFGAVAGGHHGSGGDTTTLAGYTITSGDTADMSDAFRMLAGVIGIEENDWEFAPTAAVHNQYYGVSRTGATGETADTTGTISGLCANCHGDFHSGTNNIGSVGTGMSSPWVRHPTDFDMAGIGDKEYQFFNGSLGGNTATAAYSPETPLASTQQTAVLATVNVGLTNQNATAIVNCLSCHRAHGSPYDDLLRWDYTGMNAHNAGLAAGTGCFRCHTTKDDA